MTEQTPPDLAPPPESFAQRVEGELHHIESEVESTFGHASQISDPTASGVDPTAPGGVQSEAEIERLRAEDAAMLAITNAPAPVPVAEAVAIAQSPGEHPLPVAPPAQPVDMSNPSSILSGTVAEVTVRIAEINDLDMLDTIRAVEERGSNRVGVMAALDRRTAQVAPRTDDPTATAPSPGAAADDAQTHLCSNGHPCSCTDMPEGGHSCGRTPEFEPEGPHAEELARLATEKRVQA